MNIFTHRKVNNLDWNATVYEEAVQTADGGTEEKDWTFTSDAKKRF